MAGHVIYHKKKVVFPQKLKKAKAKTQKGFDVVVFCLVVFSIAMLVATWMINEMRLVLVHVFFLFAGIFMPSRASVKYMEGINILSYSRWLPL